MDVSFIIPAFNEERFIGRCLGSVASQDCDLETEIIVSDYRSTDRTRDIAGRYGKVVKCPDRGIAKGRNYGAEFADGELLAFLDADVLIPPDYARKVWERFQGDGELVALSARMTLPSDGFRAKLVSEFIDRGCRLLSKLGTARLIGTNTVVRRSAFEECGGFPDVPSEDVAFSRLISRHGRTEYFRGTYCLNPLRRVHMDPLGTVPYYLMRDLLTGLKMSRFGFLRSLGERLEESASGVFEYRMFR